MWTAHQDKHCSRQLASSPYCEWPTVLFQGSSNQPVRVFHRDTGNTEPLPKSFSYKKHSECLSSLRPIFFFKSMCCVFESFHLVDMNLVASSTRQWTWVSVGLFYMDKHTHCERPGRCFTRSQCCSRLVFFAFAPTTLVPRGGLKSVQFYPETRRCRGDSSTSAFCQQTPPWNSSLRDSRHVLLRQIVQTFSLFIFELCAFCS